MEKAVAAEKLKHKEDLDLAETRATSALEALKALQSKTDRWLTEITRINNEMDSKSLSLFHFTFLALTDIFYMPAPDLTR